MADTNRLLRIRNEDLEGSDLLRTWANRYGGEVALSLTVLKDWLGLTSTSQVAPLVTQYESPEASGFNVLVSSPSSWLILTPSSGFAEGTITMPKSTGLIDKSEVLISTTQQIANVTFAANGASAIIGAPSALASADAVRFRYDAQSYTWYRISST